MRIFEFGQVNRNLFLRTIIPENVQSTNENRLSKIYAHKFYLEIPNEVELGKFLRGVNLGGA